MPGYQSSHSRISHKVPCNLHSQYVALSDEDNHILLAYELAVHSHIHTPTISSLLRSKYHSQKGRQEALVAMSIAFGMVMELDAIFKILHWIWFGGRA
jgi:hypothetical protein